MLLFTVYLLAYTVLSAMVVFALKHETHRKFIGRVTPTLIVAGCALATAAIIGTTSESIEANVVQHMIGGGFVSGLLLIYIAQGFRFHLPLRFLLLVILAFVSLLGVFNEIAEFLVQEHSYLLFNTTPNDTWHDLVANTCGGLLAWCYAWLLFTQKRRFTHDSPSRNRT